MDEVQAIELLQARVELFEREIASLDDQAPWSKHREVIAGAITADLTVSSDA